MNWYAKPIIEILDYYKVNKDEGLSEKQLEENVKSFGYNRLPEPEPEPKWKLFLQQFQDPIIYILILAGILQIVLSDAKDAIVIFAVVILNSIIGFWQESKAEAALKALQKMTAPEARVIRGGKHLKIPTTDLTVGDIIVVESGDRVPSDARLLDSHNLLVNESMLTGESFAIEKKETALLNSDSSLGDRINMLYSGTIIEKGRGIALVTAVGTNSEFGKISQKLTEDEDSESPLQINIEKFSTKLSYAIGASVLLIFVVGLLNGNNWVSMLLTAVGIAVSAIPEGLPVSVTITLSIGLNQMAKYKAIVKKLAAVETLGSTNVICSDKTGTLTKNQMTVMSIYSANTEYKVTGSGYDVAGEVIELNTQKSVTENANQAINKFSFVGHYCSESKINLDGSEWKITGDATESAVMIASEKLKFSDKSLATFVDLPFESENQLMAVRVVGKDKTYITAKGAAERILARCKNALNADGTTSELNQVDILNKVSEFSNRGLRVLALAYAEVENKTYHIEDIQNLTFVGIAGIQDAVRDEVAQAVLECADAGVRVVMITGDHIETAKSVGKAVNIGKDKDAPVALKGTDLEQMTDEELFAKALEIDVYARVAPEHKYRIVSALQKHNKIVAMTGDGVNDAPALKKADIGIAMGSGSEVAKEAAHMVLLNDNFTSIVSAIRRGRVILKNLQHILLYILATSFGGLLTITTSVFLALPLPILPAQLLWINMVTDGTNTFPLAFEKEHGNMMALSPRRKDAPLIPREMWIRIFFAGILMMIGTISVYYYELRNLGLLDISNLHPNLAGKSITEALSLGNPLKLPADIIATLKMNYQKAVTMAFCTLAFFQIWNVQNSRSVNRSLFFGLFSNKKNKLDAIGLASNPQLLGIMTLSLVLQFGAVLLPFMNTLLNTQPLKSNEWLIVIFVPFSIIVFVEFLKLVSSIINKDKVQNF